MQKTKILETSPKFFEIYKKEILPVLEDKETYRKKEKFLYETIRIFAISQIFLPWFLPNILDFMYKDVCIIKNFFDIGLYYLIAFLYTIIIPSALFLEVMPRINKRFLKNIKVLVVTQILKLFDNLKWSYNTEIISKEELYNSGFIENPNFGLNFDDEYTGVYKNVNFRIGESRCFGNQAYGKEKIVYYKGNNCLEKTSIDSVLLLFKTNKFVKDNIIITEKRTWRDYLFLIILVILVVTGIFVSIIDLCIKSYSYAPILIPIIVALMYYEPKDSKKTKKSKVILEDVEFHKRFNIKAINQIEARYFMTTSFIERINNLKISFKAKKIDCYSWEDNVLFIIKTKKNLFEFANIHKPLTNTDEINNLLQELDSVYKMIDHFKFDQETRL